MLIQFWKSVLFNTILSAFGELQLELQPKSSFKKINGTINEYYWSTNTAKDEVDVPFTLLAKQDFYFVRKNSWERYFFSCTCKGPVPMRWKFHGNMHFFPELSFNGNEYQNKIRVLYGAENFMEIPIQLVCEAMEPLEPLERIMNPSKSIYIFVENSDVTFYKAPPYVTIDSESLVENSHCLKLLVPCRSAKPEANITLFGILNGEGINLSSATYNKTEGFHINLCNSFFDEFFCKSDNDTQSFKWKPLPQKTTRTAYIFPFHHTPFNITCTGDSSVSITMLDPTGSENLNIFLRPPLPDPVITKHFSPESNETRFTASLEISINEINFTNYHETIEQIKLFFEFICSYNKSSYRIEVVIEGPLTSEFELSDDWHYGRSQDFGTFYSCRETQEYRLVEYDHQRAFKIGNIECLSLGECEQRQQCVQSENEMSMEYCGNVFESLQRKQALTSNGQVIYKEPRPFGIMYCKNHISWHFNKYITGISGKLYFLDKGGVPAEDLILVTTSNHPFYFGFDKSIEFFVKYSPYFYADFVSIDIIESNFWIRNIMRQPTASFETNFIGQNQVYPDVFNLSNKLGPFLMENLNVRTYARFKLIQDIIATRILYNLFSFELVPTPNMTGIRFTFTLLDQANEAQLTRKLNLSQGFLPHITNKRFDYEFELEQNGSQIIECRSDGNPTPAITWSRVLVNARTNSGAADFEIQGSRLIFPKTTSSINGKYKCESFTTKYNFTDIKIFTVRVTEKPFDWTLIGSLSGIFVFSGGILIAICIYQRKMEQKFSGLFRKLTEKEVEEFFEGSDKTRKSDPGENSDALEGAVRMPYNDMFEVNENDWEFDSTAIVGEGSSGLVFMGKRKVDGKIVAIKTMKENATTDTFIATLAELKVLMYIGYHPNIVEFIGAVTKNIQKLEIKLVLDYCVNGDLNRYLRHVVPQSPNLNFAKQSLSWLSGILSGMEHLEKRKIIHGDLATRNILLDGNLCPKITDFGLALKAKDYSGYVKKGTTDLLPWRWMAVECLTQFSFSLASDVWAFGVLAWEMFSLGKTPYPNHSWDEAFQELILVTGCRNQTVVQMKYTTRFSFAGPKRCQHEQKSPL